MEKKIEKEYVKIMSRQPIFLKHLVIKRKRKKCCLRDQEKSLEDDLSLREICKEPVDKRRRFKD